MPRDYLQVIAQLDLTSVLQGYQYTIIGTPPLEIDIDSSDLDIACQADDPAVLSRHLRHCYGHYPDYLEKEYHFSSLSARIVTFEMQEWPVEFFIQNQPLSQQNGVRHFAIEKRLLDLCGPSFKQSVIALKNRGIKTEPAFAELLGIKGDPYINLLKLENCSDSQLRGLYFSRENPGHM
ncbi:DUF4269 domain-containing protein [Kiloniella laminariae]|uniref:DUF4269 domain-containing protein n=1 Tax=Kiloniella laminariae TaxID=454162 RepID=UPI000380615A|nr:DUF4269 domain-containing protein [Kiloniella laminariae]